MKIYVCWTTRALGHDHPCATAYDAVVAAGYEPEVVHARGLGILPAFLNPTQKPEGVLRRIVTASSRPGDLCLDFFAGSGTLGAVARELGRGFLLVDSNPEAIEVMERRLGISAERPAPLEDDAAAEADAGDATSE